MSVVERKASQYEINKRVRQLRDVGVTEEELREHGIRVCNYWNKERCMQDAAQYTTRNEWLTKSPGPYKKAWKNDWLKDCTAHMSISSNRKGVKTKEQCMAEAKKYQSKIEWRKANKSFYHYAYKTEWFDECCAHMKPLDKKPIRCLNNGVVYESSADACRKLSLRCPSSILKVCNARRGYYLGYHFEYFDKQKKEAA